MMDLAAVKPANMNLFKVMCMILISQLISAILQVVILTAIPFIFYLFKSFSSILSPKYMILYDTNQTFTYFYL